MTSVDAYTFTHLKGMLHELNGYARAATNNHLTLKPSTPSISGNNIYQKKN